MSLKPQPETSPEITVDGWNGTPAQLASLVQAIHRECFPSGVLSIEVETKRRGVLTAEVPTALNDLEPGDGIRRVSVRINRPGSVQQEISDWEKKKLQVWLRSGRFGITVTCRADSEETARAMLTVAEAKLRGGSAAWARFPLLARNVVPVVLSVAITQIFTLWLLPKPTIGTVVAFAALTVLVLLPLILLAAFLCPGFEVHSGRSRLRRASWTLLAVVLIPVAIAFLTNRA